jgi:hypothetical protein
VAAKHQLPAGLPQREKTYFWSREKEPLAFDILKMIEA